MNSNVYSGVRIQTIALHLTENYWYLIRTFYFMHGLNSASFKACWIDWMKCPTPLWPMWTFFFSSISYISLYVAVRITSLKMYTKKRRRTTNNKAKKRKQIHMWYTVHEVVCVYALLLTWTHTEKCMDMGIFVAFEVQ